MDYAELTKPLSPSEVQKMRRVCRMAAMTLKYIEAFVIPGVTTLELDARVREHTLEQGGVPAPLNYKGFPFSVCTSVNQVICHGVPDMVPLKEGDLINIDITTEFDGFFGDTSKTFFVGRVSNRARRLTECALQAMEKGIGAVRPYGTTGDIGFAVEKHVTRKGFFVVRDIGGHGIGRVFHCDPFVPSYGKRNKGPQLIPWTCITVEPMINESRASLIEVPIEGSEVKIYETGDASLSAQFEHTVLITDTGYEVLTLLDG